MIDPAIFIPAVNRLPQPPSFIAGPGVTCQLVREESAFRPLEAWNIPICSYAVKFTAAGVDVLFPLDFFMKYDGSKKSKAVADFIATHQVKPWPWAQILAQVDADNTLTMLQSDYRSQCAAVAQVLKAGNAP